MKYNNQKYYDIIVYYQTNFQKFIINYLIDTKYSDKTVLEIDVRNKKMIINEFESYFFINSPKTIYKSKNSINYIKNLKLSCDIFLGSHLTGEPPTVFIKIIKFNKLFLIDDGMASFFANELLQSNNLKKIIRKKLISIQILIYTKTIIKYKQEIFSLVNKFFSIYDINTKFNIEKINPYKLDGIIINNETAFIGQPLVEFNMINLSDYINELKKIIKKEGKIIYYCHPRENWYININIANILFIKNNISLEEYFINNGLPRKIIGVYSSVLMNSLLINNKINVYYININIRNKNKDKIFNILKHNGINEYIFN